MKVITAEQIRDLDRRAMAGKEPDGTGGIPGVVLMENAGRAVVEVLEREYGPLRDKRVAIFCGTGNNGGDGFVIARYLKLAGAIPSVSVVGETSALKGDAKTHYETARHCGVYIRQANTGNTLEPISFGVDLVVDALLGTGAKGAPRDLYAETIHNVNTLECPVIAVDIPSGVDADTGAKPGEAIWATHTVTFAYPKLGLYQFPGAEHVGKLHVANIGYDWERLNVETPYHVLDVEYLRKSLAPTNLLAPRRGESNKGDYGHVGIVAGSHGMVGAPALVARAAQRVGAGLVTVLTAESAQQAIAIKLDEQMTRALSEAGGALAEAAFEAIQEFASKASVLCVGPGLTTNPGTMNLVYRLITEIDLPLVLDADGLNALAKNPDIVHKRASNPRMPLIITPHPGEAARLLNTDVAGVQADRVESVLQLARQYHAVAVLKGRHTLIAAPDGQVRINTTGNPGMATGGMGDTLTGIVGGLLSQWSAGLKSRKNVADGKNDGSENDNADMLTRETLDVVALAVHLHGLAGDRAAVNGEAGLVAGDVITHLPAALQSLKDKA